MNLTIARRSIWNRQRVVDRRRPREITKQICGVRLQPSFDDAQDGPEALEGPDLHRTTTITSLDGWLIPTEFVARMRT